MDIHLVLAAVMVTLGIAVVAFGGWLIAALVLADPELAAVRRQRASRRALGRAAARCRR